MSKGKMLLIVNSLLALAILLQAVTGVTIKYHLEPEELWENAHVVNAILLIVLTVFHLSLNWGWVKSNILKKKAKQS